MLVERQVEDRVGQLERGAERIDEKRRDDEPPVTRGQRCPHEAADRQADPREAAAASPRIAMPATGATRSPPWATTATPMMIAMTRVTTPIAASAPSPLRSAHSARAVGSDRTTSSRRRPSSAAQAARNVAPARPMMNEPKLKNVSCRTADGWVRSSPG